jgi:uncharacterized protein (TIGR02996 family)
MHPEADALLDAIFDHPDDDTPRLVYADWLQEHGQEDYAQFIRLQCAAAREKLWSDEANRLWVEIGRVWNRLTRAWRYNQFDWGWMDAISFHRGFLKEGFRLTEEDLDSASPLWDHPELLACVKIEYDEDSAGPPNLSQCDTTLLRGVRVLIIEQLDAAELDELLENPFDNLRELDLRKITVRNDAGRVLLTAERLATLQRLRLSADTFMSQSMKVKLREHYGERLLLGS